MKDDDQSMSVEEPAVELTTTVENEIKSDQLSMVSAAEQHKVSMENALDQVAWHPEYQEPKKQGNPMLPRGSKKFTKPIGPEAERKHRRRLAAWAEIEAITLILTQSAMLSDFARRLLYMKVSLGFGFVIGAVLGYGVSL